MHNIITQNYLELQVEIPGKEFDWLVWGECGGCRGSSHLCQRPNAALGSHRWGM